MRWVSNLFSDDDVVAVDGLEWTKVRRWSFFYELDTQLKIKALEYTLVIDFCPKTQQNRTKLKGFQRDSK